MTNLMGIDKNPNPVIVPDKVKSSEFGCRNCLWHCIECKQGSMYKPQTTLRGKFSCKGYAYYD
jgi:hypothetical protein